MIFNNKRAMMRPGRTMFFVGLILGLAVAAAIYLSAKGIINIIPI